MNRQAPRAGRGNAANSRPASNLEWKGTNLYRIEHYKQPHQNQILEYSKSIYVGSIIPVQFSNAWSAYVRGELRQTLNSEAAARQFLESQAQV